MNAAIESLLFALLRPIKKDCLNIQVCSSLASLCHVCSMQTSFMVENTSEMSANIEKHLPVPATKVARS